MSNLVSVPKNGSLANRNSNQNFPNVSNWLEDIFNRDLPSVFTQSKYQGKWRCLYGRNGGSRSKKIRFPYKPR